MSAMMTAQHFRAKHILEKDVAKQVRDFMALRGWRRVRNQSALMQGAGGVVRIGEKGMPDLLFIHYFEKSSGVVALVWIETKRAKGGKRRDEQITWQDLERKHGGIVLNVNDIDAFSREYERLFGWLHRGQFANAKHQTRFELEEEF
jgi:hypothetical protein